jgi:hypothetical protein
MFQVKCFSPQKVIYDCQCEKKFDAIMLAHKLTEVYSHKSIVKHLDEDTHFYDVYPSLDLVDYTL